MEHKNLISGIIPENALGADLGPPRSECGVGGLMPWAGRLWVITYLSHKSPGTGSGTGLYEMDESLALRKRPESVAGTYANRYIHYPTNQLVMGPHVIDADSRVRTVGDLVNVRLCGTMTHLEKPDTHVYMLGMEGEFFELDLESLETRKLFSLVDELGVESEAYAHFKTGYTSFGKVFVVNNSYDERDYERDDPSGRLAEWDGTTWRVVHRAPFIEVTGRGDFTDTVFATGWDAASAILKVYTDSDTTWRTYRLPKASHTFDHMWQTEWPRIREVEHERFLMDCHGMFYELSPWAYRKSVWGIRPISTHLWVLGDFCSYRGMLVMGADSASPSAGQNVLCGEPQSALWMGKTDDLWNFGKPAGWGGPWRRSAVKADTPSDPFLMNGFDSITLHLYHDSEKAVTFTVEVDPLGDGAWGTYDRITIDSSGYGWHTFPPGYSAHWVRVTSDTDCTAGAQFFLR